MNSPMMMPKGSDPLDSLGDGLERHALGLLSDGHDDQARLLYLARALLFVSTAFQSDELAEIVDSAENTAGPLGAAARMARENVDATRERLRTGE
jgi:hypothetical protein